MNLGNFFSDFKCYLNSFSCNCRKLEKRAQEKLMSTCYTHSLLDRYRKSLNEAIEVSVRCNLPPIKGHNIIFCEIDDYYNYTKFGV